MKKRKKKGSIRKKKKQNKSNRKKSLFSKRKEVINKMQQLNREGNLFQKGDPEKAREVFRPMFIGYNEKVDLLEHTLMRTEPVCLVMIYELVKEQFDSFDESFPEALSETDWFVLHYVRENMPPIIIGPCSSKEDAFDAAEEEFGAVFFASPMGESREPVITFG